MSKYRSALPPDLALSGSHVALEPMQLTHVDDLIGAARDGELWRLKVTEVPDAKGMPAFVKSSLEKREQGAHLPFIVRRLSDQRIVGTTSYYRLDDINRNLSIGYTWYSESVQNTLVNTETKLLLLTQAFERAACISVQWHTHHENTRSQAAIRRLGASFEGILRNDRILSDGRIRHTHCFSMLDTEWPASKAFLNGRLEKYSL